MQETTNTTRYELKIDSGLSFEIELFEKEAPIACHNFKQLVHKNFYDGLKIWYVDPDYIIKTGCPNNDGTGHGNYKLHLTKEKKAMKIPFAYGSLGYCNSGKDTESTQFFIFLGDEDYQLDMTFSHFGRIVTNPSLLKDLKKGDLTYVSRVED